MSSTTVGEPAYSSQRHALKLSGVALAVMTFQTLGEYPTASLVVMGVSDVRGRICTGIIYSDIGTSPLYVLNGIWPSSGPAPSEEDIIGGISAIIWSLTLVPLIKYVSRTTALKNDSSETDDIKSPPTPPHTPTLLSHTTPTHV